MPALSVVVPIYNVEEYLEPCLDSLVAQTFDDLEVVMVNDGSTDGSAEIADAYARRDRRFKLVHRPNGGLSAARNTGIGHATGDYLAFVDSDDVVVPDAYERMVGSLEKTGSDFATGNVLRLTEGDTEPARWLRVVFRETRLKTHITRFRPLLRDRIAWNKVFRRAFWDSNGLEFPEGRINEDIPVILPLHFSAKAVDVLKDPVYLWRFRKSGELSITERRLEKRALLHRVHAVTDVHDWLEQHGPRKARRWYDETLVQDDLKYYLNVLDLADDEYRQLFLDKVNALLDRTDDRIYDGLPAIERLKWHLVRRRLVDELVEVIRFQRSGEIDEVPPVRVGRHWVGDYPYRNDPRLKIPEKVYRLGSELGVRAQVDALRVEDGRLRIDGWAFIEGVGAAEPGAQKVSLVLLRPGRFRRLQYLTSAIRFRTRGTHRPDANARARLADAEWSGFSATLDPRKLRRGGRWRPGPANLFIVVRAGGLRHVRNAFRFRGQPPVTAVELPAGADVLVRALPTAQSDVVVDVTARWAAIESYRVTDGVLELTGQRRGLPAEELELELREADGKARARYPVEAAPAPTGFTVRLPVDEVARALPPRRAIGVQEDVPPDPAWELHLSAAGGGRARVALPAAVARTDAAWPAGGQELALERTRRGDAALAVRKPRALLGDAGFGPAAELSVAGERRPADADELVLFSPERLVQHAFPLEGEGDGRFRASATPAAIESLAGSLPLPEGIWRLSMRGAGERDPAALAAVAASDELAARLPVSTAVGPKTFSLDADDAGNVLLKVSRDLGEDERGPFNQRRLRAATAARWRSAPLTDSVVYSSFRGRQYSDSPRAIHEELVRRGAPLEHFWVVRDGACAVPDTATVLRENSREHHEALARARYVVDNDHFPEFFERRPDQKCVQTWHGTPLKRLGFDVSLMRGNTRRFERFWPVQKRNWQYVVSPNRFATPILRRAYQLEPEKMLETGYPRDDYLAGADRDERTRALRARLGLPEGVRVVLYAPTYRDDVRDGRGRYRLEQRLDLDRLREALGDDAVVLYRKHHYIVDDVPATPDGFVRDVSSYPDGTELLLAADVLVTDYSSMIVDFANTGRPMLFFTYDLDDYRDEMRGFYVPFEEIAPGPLLATSDELADALRDIDGVQERYAAKYDAFVRRFCELDDGRAAARVVDEVFES